MSLPVQYGHRVVQQNGVVWVVSGDNDPKPAPGQALDQFQSPQLVAVIQVRCGFVQQDQLGFLDHGPGNGDHLPLTAGDGGVALVAQMVDVQLPQDRIHLFIVLFAGVGQEADIGGPPHDHKILDRVSVGGHVGLGHIADDFGHVRQLHLFHGPAFQQDLAGLWRKQVGQTVEQGALSSAVAAQNGKNLALIHGERHLIKNSPVRIIGKLQIFYFQNHLILILCL